MITLSNRTVLVDLDPAWPRVVRLVRRDVGGSLAGCSPEAPFTIEVNGALHNAGDLSCTVSATDSKADYAVDLADRALTFRFRFSLEAERLTFSLESVEGPAEPELRTWRIPDHRLVSGLATRGDAFLRHVTRRTNWSRHWCPGTGTYDAFEDFGLVGDATAELGPRRASHACIWNEDICAAFDCSIFVEPLVVELSPDGAVLEGRAGRFSVSAGTHAYRLRGELARPFQVSIGVLGDYNGDGRIDWCDAAGWEGDRVFAAVEPLYQETVVYKLMVARSDGKVNMTFDQCLPVIRAVHGLSGGLAQVVYLVGWQYQGHDTGYPSLDKVNEAVGGAKALRRLMAEAKALNCSVSVHANVDDTYPEHPGYDASLASREPGRAPYGWFHSVRRGRQEAHSLNHTLDVETGNLQRRLDALFDLLPIERTIHFDAHRPYNEAWLKDGSHVNAECEVQRGLLPIRRMLADRGVDLTTEDTNSEKRGLYNWLWHGPKWREPYTVVMTHGRVPFRAWQGLASGLRPRLETEALGQRFVCPEGASADVPQMVAAFYLYWMYAEILSRKKMTGYWIGDWGFGVKAWYEDDTWTSVGPARDLGDLETWYEGIPIARGRDRFLPWRDDVIYAFSEEGGPQEWTLPSAWEGTQIEASLLADDRAETPLPVTVKDRTIRYDAPAGRPIRLRRSAAARRLSENS